MLAAGVDASAGAAEAAGAGAVAWAAAGWAAGPRPSARAARRAGNAAAKAAAAGRVERIGSSSNEKLSHLTTARRTAGPAAPCLLPTAERAASSAAADQHSARAPAGWR